MAEDAGQVQKVLATLAAHGDIIAEALSGAIHAGGKRDKAIDALVAVHALAPYEEGIYQLNPRLREFISDHLASYNPNQSLNRLSESTSQARAQWRSLRTMRREGSTRDMDRLEWALDSTITSLSYEMDRNLTLLNSLISTDFGNVDSLRGKIEQNEYYDNEVRHCLDEIRQMKNVMDTIADEALVEGIVSVRTLVNSRILSRLSHWTTRLNDVQRMISERLFLARRLQKRQHNLGKMALWLTRHQLSEGFELDLLQRIPDALLHPQAFALRWTIDPHDHDPVVRDTLEAATARLPAPPERTQDEAQERKPTVLSYTEQQEIPPERHPADDLIDELLDELDARAEAGNANRISLLEWKRESELDQDIEDETWILYACNQLMGMKLPLEYLFTEEREPDVFNDRFYDVLVRAPHDMMAA